LGKVETVLTSGNDTTLDAIVLGWMESIGPTTVAELAERLHLSADDERLHVALQPKVILRGRFRPNSALSTQHQICRCRAPEWCHRRLLARIHRLTIGRLRKKLSQ
jgi:ATP-dependent Lhr-like helicase